MKSKIDIILFCLLKCEINGMEISQEKKNLITPEVLPTLYKLSKAHDLAHLVTDALDRNGLLDDSDISKKFRAERNLAVYRHEQMQYELDELCRILESEKIEFIPLKGSVIRKYYPEPWMRTSCDIDILVKKENLETAIKSLCEKLGYSKVNRGTHDVSLYAPSNVHVELHFSLLEDPMANNASKILDTVWDRVEPTDNNYQKSMQDDFFYYYHIAHMAKHIEFGGCGIKPFLDLWILNERIQFNQEKRDALLIEGELKKFEEVAKNLAYIWFEEQEHNPITKKLEDYILRGGVYGSTENKVAAQSSKKGKGLRYILSRIWYPYDLLKKRYPRVEKCKLLIPYYQICRWFRFLFKGKKRAAIIEARESSKLSNEKAENIQNMLQDLGLQ